MGAHERYKPSAGKGSLPSSQDRNGSNIKCHNENVDAGESVVCPLTL